VQLAWELRSLLGVVELETAEIKEYCNAVWDGMTECAADFACAIHDNKSIIVAIASLLAIILGA